MINDNEGKSRQETRLVQVYWKQAIDDASLCRAWQAPETGGNLV